MAEDKKLQAGIAGFLNKKTTNKAPRQKVVEKKTAKKAEATPKQTEKVSTASSKAAKIPAEVIETSPKSVSTQKTARRKARNTKPSEELKRASTVTVEKERKNPGPKSNKIEGISYKQVSARIPEVLKDKLKQSLYGELFKQYTQDEFIEQAIIDLMNKHGIKVPKY